MNDVSENITDPSSFGIPVDAIIFNSSFFLTPTRKRKKTYFLTIAKISDSRKVLKTNKIPEPRP